MRTFYLYQVVVDVQAVTSVVWQQIVLSGWTCNEKVLQLAYVDATYQKHGIIDVPC